jgi:hypothetical protein
MWMTCGCNCWEYVPLPSWLSRQRLDCLCTLMTILHPAPRWRPLQVLLWAVSLATWRTAHERAVIHDPATD